MKSEFIRGMKGGAPFILVIVPFSMLFGVVATEAGLNLTQTMGFSFLVIAGASQFAAVQLMTDNAPAFFILATSLAVNLRMAMYSASITPHLGDAPLWKRAIVAYFLVDQSYAVCAVEYERRPDMTTAERYAFYFGCILPICALWYAMTFLGAVIGSSIPPEFALDFALPITFIALFAPMLKTFAHVAAALTSIVVALALSWMPVGTGLLVAAGCAMAVGALVETRMEARK
ncbi:branched-chain amino acid ABC transporter permease [Qingshengfaniella alkalisoli]|uniref:Branched-chain amino acid ABC transporter permease n=2 Tax=Qingshengfaniella alkalisoli TaxID=2599296 RepID=A0A5B8IX76_9RHOB|nr:branched-chain amino acid ABC transporter permease [Qingshengfaniella alkalisoli]